MQNIKDILWSYGISGDNSIISVIIKDYEDINSISDIIKAHEYWKTKGIVVDLVMINKEGIKYEHPIWDSINEIVASSHLRNNINKPGGAYLIRGEILNTCEYENFLEASNIVVENGEYNVKRKDVNELMLKDFEDIEYDFNYSLQKKELDFFNGIGGFDVKNNEYVIYPAKDNLPPMPWCNVLANKNIGCVATETGGGFSWMFNSREYRITPWSNDVVSDKRGEIIYIRDEKTGKLFNPYLLPCNRDGFYEVRYGLGYCKYISEVEGIITELNVFVPIDDKVKISMVKLKNTSNVRRDLSVVYFVDPVLTYYTNSREKYVHAEYNNEKIKFRNSYDNIFEQKEISMGFNQKPYSYCLNRDSFFGLKNESSPKIFDYEDLGNLDEEISPIGAIQLKESLEPGETKSVICFLGDEEDFEKYSYIESCEVELENTINFFKKDIMKIKINTPNKAMNLLVNVFLLYQSLVCRIWGRSAFYQSGGAYGFRDQLQDSLALLNVKPEIAREQILLHASRQFEEGDVLHWWHEEAKKGTRTKFSDDLLWLPYCVAEYVEATGDKSILEEEIGFVKAEILGELETEKYIEFFETERKATIYEHCILAIEHAYRLGENRLVLMGSGDWNDGMNKVGEKGQGESVWLSWFLYKIFVMFSPICKYMQDEERGNKFTEFASDLARSINENAWDGEWYKRAFFDDGTPLGSIKNEECKIDSISQSWSVISGAGELEKSKKAMVSAENYLIDYDNRIIKLLTPPFKNSKLNPGYIKNYPKGIRENGGQYTHASVWLGIAESIMKNGNKAYQIFDMLNPINRTRTDLEVNTYKVEPYVMVADIYTNSEHVGRGGWTWYTGAAAWMYRFAIEYLLGIKKKGEKIVLNPVINENWDECEVEYKYNKSVYKIRIVNNMKTGTSKLVVDGVLRDGNDFELIDDVGIHFVEYYGI